jgi:2-dehydro-3-deoxyphosphooctonate aldolase (KDO 8-P synthase)
VPDPARRVVRIGGVEIGGPARDTFAVIAGPCVVETRELCLRVAEELRAIGDRTGAPVVFKASYTKANRSALSSFTGIGVEEGLAVLRDVRDRTGLPVLSDVHCREEIPLAAEVLDCLQIPAFLCRQTELLRAAGATRKAVNIKKGQFLPPADIAQAAEKAASAGASGVLVTERGTTFGYGDLVVDMRSLVIMKETGWPVVYDVTHSQQRPGGRETRGGREFAEPVARGAVAVGVDALFFETHPDPASGLSDRETMLPLSTVEPMLRRLLAIHRATLDAVDAARA